MNCVHRIKNADCVADGAGVCNKTIYTVHTHLNSFILLNPAGHLWEFGLLARQTKQSCQGQSILYDLYLVFL